MTTTKQMKPDPILHQFTCAGRIYSIYSRLGKYGYSIKGRRMNQTSFPCFDTGLEAHAAAIAAARELSPRAKMTLIPRPCGRRTLIEHCC